MLNIATRRGRKEVYCIGLALVASILPTLKSSACCAVTRDVGAVVNADQTVIMVWDAARQTQHFIRQASFKSDVDDVGFIVPTPSRPQLEESGDGAFSRLKWITTPVKTSHGIACSAAPRAAYGGSVRVIEEKRVAGYDATVLTAGSGADLAAWLRDHGYSYSPQVAEWAHPYVTGGWMMTALKVAKTKDGRASPDLKASALRLSFKTDRPLFPYREPESATAAKKLGTSARLLRIYFIAEDRYRATLGTNGGWSGRVVWSGDITAHRTSLLTDLKLPADTGPSRWWLTEFEDRWPYAKAAGDVYFAHDSNQRNVQRHAGIGHFGNDAPLAIFAAVAVFRIIRRRRK